MIGCAGVACDWLTVEQVNAALGANAPAGKPGFLFDDEINDGVKLHGCSLVEKAYNRVTPTVWIFPDAAATQAHLASMESSDQCVALEGLGAKAEYCQFKQIQPEISSAKNVNVFVSDTIVRQLYWHRSGDWSTLDIQAQLIALYKQVQFPA